MLEIPAFSPICNTAHYQKDAPVLIFLLEIFLTLLSQTSRSWSLLGALTSLTRGSFSIWRGWNRRTCSQVERDLMSLLLETIPLSLFFYWSPSAQWSIQSWKQLDTKISETNPSTAVRKTTQANLSADNIHQFTSFLVKQGRTGANFYHLSLTKKNLALTRVLIWFHLLEWVGRLGLILIKMNSSALSPLLLALSHWYLFEEMRSLWGILERGSWHVSPLKGSYSWGHLQRWWIFAETQGHNQKFGHVLPRSACERLRANLTWGLSDACKTIPLLLTIVFRPIKWHCCQAQKLAQPIAALPVLPAQSFGEG